MRALRHLGYFTMKPAFLTRLALLSPDAAAEARSFLRVARVPDLHYLTDVQLEDLRDDLTQHFPALSEAAVDALVEEHLAQPGIGAQRAAFLRSMEAAAQQRAAREEVPAVVPRPVGTTTSGAVQYLTSEQKEVRPASPPRLSPVGERTPPPSRRRSTESMGASDLRRTMRWRP